MKLFGGKHRSQHSGGHAASKPEKKPSKGLAKEEKGTGKERKTSEKKHKLTGLQRGLLMLLASIAVLVLVVLGVMKAMIKPPERSSPDRGSSTVDDDGDGKPDREPFKYVDDDGNEVEVQFEAPGSLVDGVYNILVVGTDKSSFLTDTIMIAHLDAIEHKLALLSVPRDTLVYGNYSVPKINSVYGGAGGGEKGIAALEQMLASMLGFEVDGYVAIDLEAFVEIINLMGGVTFNVPQRMYYSDPTQGLYIDLAAGEQTLTGEQAVGVVRYRSGYAAGDIRRTEVQRDFVKAVAEQLFSLKTLTKIQPIIESAITHVETDLTLENMLYFATEFLKCDVSAMETFTLPGAGVWLNGGSYYSLYPNQCLEIINEYFNPYDADIALSSLHIRTSSGYSGSSSGGSSSGGSSSSGSSSSSGGSSSGNTSTPEPQEPTEPVVDPNDPNGTGALDPGTTDPGTTDPGTTDPGTTDPGTTDPGTTDPGTTDPGTTDPGTTDPGATDPGTTDPGTTDPGTTDPGTTTPDPVEPTNPDSGDSSGVGILDPNA